MAKSALRVLQIMEYIADQHDGFTHAHLAQGLNVPKSSLTVLLNDLHSQGYLQRNLEAGKFTIGVHVLWLANAYLRKLNLARLGAPIVGELYSAMREYGREENTALPVSRRRSSITPGFRSRRLRPN